MIYDAFSPILLMQLEALGFCGFGEAKDFIAEGNLGPKGALPCNTNGGLIGEGYIHGLNLTLEAVRQLRGDAANQLDRPPSRPGLRQPDRNDPAPALSRTSSDTKGTPMPSVLAGLSVLDLSQGISGPITGMLLVGPRGRPSPRSSRPEATGSGRSRVRTPGSAGRRSVELDLAKPEDRATFHVLVRQPTSCWRASPRARPSSSGSTRPRSST